MDETSPHDPLNPINMKIHLLPDEGMDPRRVERILSLLEEPNGVIDFQLQEPVPVPTVSEAAEFEELFQVCARARVALRLPEKDYLVLLTDRPNRRNYFASMDPGEPRNSFVHADDWKLFLDCEDVLPVAFTVLNIVLLHKTESDQALLPGVLHMHPIGCVHDFCGDKTDVIFKLRTGDICDVCIERMRRKGLSDIYLEHAIRILGHLSRQMRHHFSFEPNVELSQMEIDMDAATLTLKDYGGIRIPLNQVELSFYIMLLLHPDGILRAEWEQNEDFQSIWEAIYWKLRPLKDNAPSRTILAHRMKETRRNDRTTGIKEKFEKMLGPTFGNPYIVGVVRGEKHFISVPRNLVTIRNFNSFDEVIEGNQALEKAWRDIKAKA